VTDIADWNNKLISIQDLVHALPPEHFATLKYLCEHLSRVAALSKENLMTARNIAIVFGPALLRKEDDGDGMVFLKDMSRICFVVQTLVEYCGYVFGPIEFVEEEECEKKDKEDIVDGACEEGEEEVDGIADCEQNEGPSELPRTDAADVREEAKQPLKSPSFVDASGIPLMDDFDFARQARWNERRGSGQSQRRRAERGEALAASDLEEFTKSMIDDAVLEQRFSQIVMKVV
jgi:hypothetical protein